MALCLHTLGVQLDQLLCHLFCRRFDSAFGVDPFLGAETVELDVGVLLWSDIFRDKIELSDGDIEVVTLGVLDHDVILQKALYVHLADTTVNADTVDRVDDVLADGKLAEVVDRLAVFRVTAAFLFVGSVDGGKGVEDEILLGIFDTRAEHSRHDVDKAAFGFAE